MAAGDADAAARLRRLPCTGSASTSARTAAVLGRLDALVFTAGIGEHSPVLRAAVVDGLGVLGLRLDAAANAEGPAERRVSAADSSAQVWVVPTDEEREIARATLVVSAWRTRSEGGPARPRGRPAWRVKPARERTAAR